MRRVIVVREVRTTKVLSPFPKSRGRKQEPSFRAYGSSYACVPELMLPLGFGCPGDTLSLTRRSTDTPPSEQQQQFSALISMLSVTSRISRGSRLLQPSLRVMHLACFAWQLPGGLTPFLLTATAEPRPYPDWCASDSKGEYRFGVACRGNCRQLSGAPPVLST
jgi:hypothetical protein